MAKKIKELTDVMVDREYDNDIDAQHSELNAAYLALENNCYEQAWNHFYKTYSLKPSDPGYSSSIKGEAAHGLCKVMQEIPNNDEFLKKLMETDPTLVRKAARKVVTPDDARRTLGRKYLVYAADDCGYYPAMVEYALNCVGKGPDKSFVFPYDEDNARIGLHWANRLLNSDMPQYKSIGYVVHAIYHLASYRTNKQHADKVGFCDNALNAWNTVGERNEYATYFYAHLCCDPKFQFYEGGRYYDERKGYDLFCKVAQTGKDPDLVASAAKIKSTYETKYPHKIKK